MLVSQEKVPRIAGARILHAPVIFVTVLRIMWLVTLVSRAEFHIDDDISQHTLIASYVSLLQELSMESQRCQPYRETR